MLEQFGHLGQFFHAADQSLTESVLLDLAALPEVSRTNAAIAGFLGGHTTSGEGKILGSFGL